MEDQKQMRSLSGQSIVELLIGTLIFSIVATVLLSMLSINTKAMSGFFNKTDVISQASDAMTKIGVLVRTARGFGDQYGVIQPNAQPMFDFSALLSGDPKLKQFGINATAPTSSLLNGTGFLLSPSFPAPGDPYYGTGILPNGMYGGTWPMTGQMGPPSGPVAPAAPSQYTLAQDTLIVQVPVFVGTPPGGGGLGLDPSSDVGGAQKPYIWPATYNGKQAGANGVMQAMDTYVFRVLPDPNQPGTWMMQEAAFPACPANVADPAGGTYTGHPTNVTLPTTGPMTLVKGIVGPLDLNGNINVFTYVEKCNNTFTNTPPDNAHVLSDYTGIIVNMEVLKNQSGTKASVAHFKTEYYLRNNSQITLMGPPNQ